MKVNIKVLSGQEMTYEEFWMNMLNFLSVPEDEISVLILANLATALYSNNMKVEDMKKTLSGYKEKVRTVHRHMQELQSLLDAVS